MAIVLPLPLRKFVPVIVKICRLFFLPIPNALAQLDIIDTLLRLPHHPIAGPSTGNSFTTRFGLADPLRWTLRTRCTSHQQQFAVDWKECLLYVGPSGFPDVHEYMASWDKYALGLREVRLVGCVCVVDGGWEESYGSNLKERWEEGSECVVDADGGYGVCVDVDDEFGCVCATPIAIGSDTLIKGRSESEPDLSSRATVIDALEPRAHSLVEGTEIESGGEEEEKGKPESEKVRREITRFVFTTPVNPRGRTSGKRMRTGVIASWMAMRAKKLIERACPDLIIPDFTWKIRSHAKVDPRQPNDVKFEFQMKGKSKKEAKVYEGVLKEAERKLGGMNGFGTLSMGKKLIYPRSKGVEPIPCEL
ncbi:hypothetical protein BDP27DRAFT_1438335 [Rhodocollybia butyracea]|uniref:Uncharacterized protein n=1 Tax=Rhodocollybia butyracea TaxID=206335 RepID=A0A9P5TUN4_9AGAR|nr:hypothetical protein BDP27DRAFT_1438335 [Rhodocollybia butyracea]